MIGDQKNLGRKEGGGAAYDCAVDAEGPNGCGGAGRGAGGGTPPEARRAAIAAALIGERAESRAGTCVGMGDGTGKAPWGWTIREMVARISCRWYATRCSSNAAWVGPEDC